MKVSHLHPLLPAQHTIRTPYLYEVEAGRQMTCSYGLTEVALCGLVVDDLSAQVAEL